MQRIMHSTHAVAEVQVVQAVAAVQAQAEEAVVARPCADISRNGDKNSKL